MLEMPILINLDPELPQMKFGSSGVVGITV